MLNEVYLMSSLPSLSFGQAPPITLEEFREMAGSELSAKSCKLLDRASIQSNPESGELPDPPKKAGKEKRGRLRKVKAMQDDLQKDITGIREARIRSEKARPELLPLSVLEANPLDREVQIMHWQWERLDGIQAGKAFTLDEVIVYKLKLQLLFRLQSFTVERGTAVLDSVVNPKKKKED